MKKAKAAKIARKINARQRADYMRRLRQNPKMGIGHH
jgi:hypothetical protein